MPSAALTAVLRSEGLSDLQASKLVNEGSAEELRSQADALAAHVPPATAGPLTNHDRRYRDAATELRELAEQAK